MKNGKIIFKDGSERWFKNDKLHREGGPAIYYKSGTEEWWIDGRRHREDGPAVIFSKEYICNRNNLRWPDQEWWFEGVRHRLDGPATIYLNGDKKWFVNGTLVKSIIDENEYWFKDSKLHREDGPAAILSNGAKEWYLNNIFLSKQKWWERISDEMKLKCLFNGEGL
jgi:hypothetical protein